MDFLSGFITTLGLDKTFFSQFILVAILYFVLNRMLFTPYLNFLEKRNALTKGKFSEGQTLQSEIEILQKKYVTESQDVNTQFQKTFAEIKQNADQEFKKEEEGLKKRHTEFLKSQKEELNQAEKKSEQALKKALPLFVESLVKKMKQV